MSKKFIKYLLIVIWLIVIFSFSGKDSAESDGQSKGLIENTVSGTITVTDKIGITNINPTEEDIDVIVDNLNHPIRKLAHATVYFVLGILVLNALETNKDNLKRNVLITLAFCFFYACTDEFHQLFIDGRSGSFVDCLIDTAGAAVACGCFALFLSISKKWKNVHNIQPKNT